MRETGDAFSIADIAARSGVHATSIYRRWGTREALIVDAVRSHIGSEIPIPDTGSLAGDLREFLDRSVAFLQSPLGSQLVRATATSTPLATTDNRLTYWPERVGRIAVVLERAIERGEIAGDIDIEVAVELLLAPLYFRLLITRQPLDDSFAERLCDVILRYAQIGSASSAGAESVASHE
ncbi:MAG: TetR/AcrR family transcriptional regulator C-terminal ligand-binding domain-containing protein [Thermomicrobiales bacterium]|nr:TetR/AcrR family transcriptional regulator C-terminal ligand-binding domain-containing protein [Thermomicrobiales bacterium]